MIDMATIYDVKIPFVSEGSVKTVTVDLLIDYEEIREDIVISFEIFSLTVNPHTGCTTWVAKDCRNSFNQLCNLLKLYGASDIYELLDVDIMFMYGKKGYAISDRAGEKWVVCLDDIPCRYYTKAQAELLLS